MAANAPRLTLFDLPIELRLQIWAHALPGRVFTMANGGTLVERSLSVHRSVNICQESRDETKKLIQASSAGFDPMQDAVCLSLAVGFLPKYWLRLWTLVNSNSKTDIRKLVLDNINLSGRPFGMQRLSESVLRSLAAFPALEEVTIEAVRRGKSRSSRYAGMGNVNKPYAVLRQKTLEKALVQITALLKDEESKNATWKAPKVKLSQLA